MTGPLDTAMVEALQAERLRAAAAYRRGRGRRRRRSEHGEHAAVVLRFGDTRDAAALARGRGDRVDGLPAPLLVAEVAGRPRAALSLANGAALEDSHAGAGALLELLQLRSIQLRFDDDAPGRVGSELQPEPGRRRRFRRRRSQKGSMDGAGPPPAVTRLSPGD